MNRILVINLARLGDIVQSAPMLHALKQEYAAGEITMLVNSRFAQICSLMPWVDETLELDFNRAGQYLAGEQASIDAAYGDIKAFFERLQAKGFTRVINITPHYIGVFSALLAEHGSPAQKRRSDWPLYYMNVTRHWNTLPLHTADLFMKIAGLAPRRSEPKLAVPAAAAHWAQEFLRARGYRDGMQLVGFHPGASTREKQWPAEYFIELGKKILAAGQSMIILYGSDPKDDISGQLGRSCVNALGATTIPQLAALLQVTDILITNDTGPMHIAAACGTRVISIHMGKEMCRTTGPCCSGSMAVQPRIDCHPCEHPEQCRQQTCRYAVTPGLVFNLMRLCRDAVFAQPGDFFRDDLAGAAVFIAGYDHNDLRDYYPLIKSDITVEDLCYRLLRIMWCTALDTPHDRLPDPEGIPGTIEGLCSVLLKHYTPASLKSHGGQWTTMLAGLQTIEDCGREGVRTCDAMRVHADEPHSHVRSLRELSRRLEALDYKIIARGAALPLLVTLSHMFCVEKENLAGDGLAAQVLHTRRIYQNLRQRSRILQDIIRGFNVRMAGDAVSIMHGYDRPAEACRLLQTDAA